ncbi:pyridoxal-phosphate dependent enzyme [Paraburkholderia sp. GAS448]|uniref:pyridoxal-phosphate dependent enzyme n=1 Tax=Paraburkholderia sp. GAS448 TaxID=3035136 RepID=UPI003D20DB4E
MTLHIETPLIKSRTLSLKTGRTVLLKLEGLQPSGSFKLRGVGFACEEHKRRGARRFVTASGGNFRFLGMVTRFRPPP